METLDKGIFTQVDPTLIPEGGLVDATNARYKPGDPAIWQAEGRRLAGGVGGHRADRAFSLSVRKSGFTTFFPKIMYTKTGQLDRIFAIPAKDDPGHTDLSPLANPYVTSTSGTLGTFGIDTVDIGEEHYLLSGGVPMIVFQDFSANPYFQRSGFPEQSGPLTISPSGGGTNRYFYWITWYNSIADQEGAAALSSVASGIGTANFITMVETYWAPPPHTTHVRVYRAKAQTTVLPNPFPIGFRIAEVTIGSIAVVNHFYEIYTDLLTYPDATIEDNHLGAPTGDYKFVSVRVESQVAQVSRDSPFPKASTGDLYEESLVTDDLDNPGIIAYSPANLPGSCPEIFRVSCPGVKTIDPVRCIRAVGSRLGVWLGHALWRINWLPRESDFDFSAGRVKDLVSPDRGTFSHETVTLFTIPGGQALAAFLDQTGLYATDLYSVVKLAEQLDWKNLLNGVSVLKLVNNADAERLELCIGGFGNNDVLYYFHYDEGHLKKTDTGFQLAVTGPITRPGGIKILRSIRTENGSGVVITGDTTENKSLHYEGFGFADEATGNNLQFSLTSREIYPFGQGLEGIAESFYVHIRPAGGPGTWTARLTTVTKVGVRSSETPPIQLGSHRLIERTSHKLFESLYLTVSGTQTGETSVAVNGFGIRPSVLREAQRLSP